MKTQFLALGRVVVALLVVAILFGCGFSPNSTETYPPASDSIAMVDRAKAIANECGISPFEPFPTIEATPDEGLNALFTRTDEGWTGGDDLDSVLLPDGRTLWLSTNPYFGGRNADGSRNPSATTRAHNALLVQTEDQLEIPAPQDGIASPDADQWYLLGQIIGTDEGVVVVADRQRRTGNGLFDVARQGTTLITLSPSDFSVQSTTAITPTPVISYTYGDALLDDGDYLYIYGTHHVEGFTYQTHVARASHDAISAWEYATGEGWSDDPSGSKPIFEGRIFGMMKQDNRYFLLTLGSNSLIVYQGCGPVGPWGNAVALYTNPDRYPAEGKNEFSITSASVHPTPTEREWLISYHVNFFFGEPEEVNSVADVGRPRFVRIRLKQVPLDIKPVANADVQPLEEALRCTLLPTDTKVTGVSEDTLTTLFDRNDAGWTAADSGYTVPLPDGRVVWLFGDTVLGGVNPDGSTINPFFSIRNSMVVQGAGDAAETLETRIGGTLDAPLDTVPPPNGLLPSISWYWPGAGTVEGDHLYVVMGRFRQSGVGSWGFGGMGSDIATFSLPDLTFRETQRVAEGSVVQYGAALLAEPPYTYIYGGEGRDGKPTAIHIARVPTGDFLSPWHYFTGEGWSSDPLASKPIFDSTSSSVVKMGEVYWLIHHISPFGDKVIAYQSCAPWGPWSSPIDLYTTPESQQNLITYISIIHPEFSEGNSLLLTYSVNGEGTTNVAGNYRPRFVRLTVETP